MAVHAARTKKKSVNEQLLIIFKQDLAHFIVMFYQDRFPRAGNLSKLVY